MPQQFIILAKAQLSTTKEMEDLVQELVDLGLGPGVVYNSSALTVTFAGTLPPTRTGIVLNVFEGVQHEITLKNANAPST